MVLLTKFYSDNVILVANRSSCRTAEISRKAGAHVIVHEGNKGKGAAPKNWFLSRSQPQR
ncbi:glycosyltransferase family protein [Methanosarcina siciliae]|uniref:hypothetical protein n=1 Tax=Methanosarcina siciliae TaxID=38027 RepID=UPI002F3EC61D